MILKLIALTLLILAVYANYLSALQIYDGVNIFVNSIFIVAETFFTIIYLFIIKTRKIL